MQNVSGSRNFLTFLKIYVIIFIEIKRKEKKMFVIGIFTGINIVGFIFMLLLANCGGNWDVLIYPALYDFLSYRFSIQDKHYTIVKIIFTLLFLPALIVYFTLMTLYAFISLIPALIYIKKKEKEFKYENLNRS